MKHQILLFISAILSTLCLISCGNDILTLEHSQFIKLDSLAVADVPENAPGIAVGIVMDGQVVYQKYAGYANIEDSTLIGPRSRFNIASNGKQFTALAILSLIDEGKLTLGGDIRTYFPELFKTVEQKITVANLLNHTSGVRDVYDLWALQGITWWEHTYDNKDVLRLLEKQQELNFEPGSKYVYSNSNYMLLAELISRVSGTDFIDYTNQMFQDLNMPNTSFEPDYKNIAGPVAKPYFNFDTWFGYDWIWNAYGDGNIFSTLEDQMEFEKILQTKNNQRFSKEQLEQSQSLIAGSTNKKYGYGVEFMEHRNIPYKYHGGSTGAWKAITARFEEQGFSIVTLTNSGKIDPMTQTLNSANVLLGLDFDDEQIKLRPDEVGPYVSLDDVVGMYEINGAIWRFVNRDGELYLLRSGRNDTKLVREADNIFQQWNDSPFKQEFTLNAEGEMQVTAYYTRTPTFTLTRKNVDLTNYDYSAIEGQYMNAETGVAFSVKHQGGLDYIFTAGEQIMEAILLDKKRLTIGGYDYGIRIGSTDQGQVSELFLNSGRVQNLRFKRVE